MPDDKTLTARAVLRDLDRMQDAVDKDDRMSHVDCSHGISDDVHADARTMIALTIGTRFDLASMHAVKDGVRRWEEVRRRFPESPIYICVMGYDDDPRESREGSPDARAAQAHPPTTPRLAGPQPGAVDHLRISSLVSGRAARVAASNAERWRSALLGKMEAAPRGQNVKATETDA